ncbi:MAG: hypothetical protein KGN76_04970 [Acidobacteriota bacterium]|nr:hypothetical protein [Acidobacteriota bacterium]
MAARAQMRGVRGAAGAALLYVLLTILLSWPLGADPAGHTFSQSPDTRLYLWTLEWDAHAFIHQPFSIFDANIYYPFKDTLAYSENLIGSALFAAPVLWLTGNPVLAFNIVTLLSCVLCALGAWLLARKIGIGPAGALLCGVVFGFSPPRFLRIEQLHLATIQWLPFCLAFLHAYLDEGRARDLRLAVACFTLQALSSGHGVVFLAIAIVLLLGWRLALGEPVALVRRIRDLGVTGAVLAAPAVLLVLPYHAVQAGVGLRRSLGTLENWAINSGSFFASPTHVQVFVLAHTGLEAINRDARAYLFPGYLPLVLAAVAVAFAWCDRQRPPEAVPGRGWRWLGFATELVALGLLGLAVYATVAAPIRVRVTGGIVLSIREVWRPWLWFGLALALRLALRRRAPVEPAVRLRRRVDALRGWRARHRRDATLVYLLITVLSGLLSVGPPFSLWPYVYWLPGFDFIRVPSRFTLLGVLGLAVLAGIGFDRLTARLAPSRRTAAAVAAGILLVVEFAAFPLHVEAYRVEIPPVDRWLATRPGRFAIAEVPEGDPRNAGQWERRETTWMLHSTAHWQKTVQGYSGFRPPELQRLYVELTRFPDETSLDHLARLGVQYVVVHTDLYPPGEWPAVEARLVTFRDRLTLVHADGAGRVYELHTGTAELAPASVQPPP